MVEFYLKQFIAAILINLILYIIILIKQFILLIIRKWVYT